jgi:hypothetical protein
VSTARNNLAWLIITDSRPGDPRLLEALELARQVVSDTGGQNAGYCDTLAEAWLRLGRPDKALEWGRRALMIDPFSDYLSRQNERFESYSEGFSTSGSVVHLEKWRE